MRCVAMCLLFSVACWADAAEVLVDDFDGQQIAIPGVVATWSGAGTVEAVRGYEGVGNASGYFHGSFLRNSSLLMGGSLEASSTTLTLSNLPLHTTVSLKFLLAIIDSWDIASSHDSFNVLVDNVPVFQRNFTNNPDADLQGYTPAPGVQLLSRPFPQLGFNDDFPNRIGFDDSAYDMGLAPEFANISHSADSLTIKMFAGGPDWQGGFDESWAIDNVSVTVGVPEPSTFVLLVMGAIALIGFIGRRYFTPLVLALIVGVASQCNAEAIQWSAAEGGNNHWYDLVMPSSYVGSYTWTDAKLAAEARGGYLATLTGAGENNFLGKHFKSFLNENEVPGTGPQDSAYAWIGLYAPTPTSNFQWVTNEPYNYVNWASSEPNFFGDPLWQYVHYWTRQRPGDTAWTWNNEQNAGFAVDELHNRYGYIVEYNTQPVPEPSSIILLLVGGIAIFAYKRRQRRS